MSNHVVAYVHAYVGMGRNAGGETTLHDMLRFLVENGWSATAVVSQPAPGQGEYWVDGVQVLPQKDKRTILAHVPKASVALSHLDNSERTLFVARKFRTPSALLVHSDHPFIRRYLALGPDLAVFNTDWVKASHGFTGDGIVVHPAVVGARYVPSGDAPRSKITMVNMWSYKGSEVFWALAEAMPDQEFLAVKGGYGEQDIRSLPNVEVWDNTDDMASVYAMSKAILMPSHYESYGRIAVEAASQGIPAIVADTPGLREALGDSAHAYVRQGADDEVAQYCAALGKLKTKRQCTVAGNKANARFAVLEEQSEAELAVFLQRMNSLAENGRILRGW